MRLLLLSLGGERSVSRKADGAPRGAVTHYKPISDPASVGTTQRQPSLIRHWHLPPVGRDDGPRRLRTAPETKPVHRRIHRATGSAEPASPPGERAVTR